MSKTATKSETTFILNSSDKPMDTYLTIPGKKPDMAGSHLYRVLLLPGQPMKIDVHYVEQLKKIPLFADAFSSAKIATLDEAMAKTAQEKYDAIVEEAIKNRPANHIEDRKRKREEAVLKRRMESQRMMAAAAADDARAMAEI